MLAAFGRVGFRFDRLTTAAANAELSGSRVAARKLGTPRNHEKARPVAKFCALLPLLVGHENSASCAPFLAAYDGRVGYIAARVIRKVALAGVVAS